MRLSGFLLILLLSSVLYSQSLNREWTMLKRSGVYENFEIRKKYQAVINAKSFEAVSAPKRIFIQRESEVNVRFEARKTSTAFYLMFLNQFEERFPIWSSGSYIIKKDIESGEFIQAKLFLFNDEESFIRLYPTENRTRLDLHIFGRQIYRGVRLPMEFSRVVISPLSKIVELTGNKIDWDSILTDHNYSEWKEVREFSQKIVSKLPQLGDNEDGAYNESGELVYIETLEPQVTDSKVESGGLNCSGFVKWTVDNLYYELTGSYMPIEPLKKKHYNLRGNSWSERAEESRDPYFGLDWTRNISWYYKKELYPYLDVGFDTQDVKHTPFFLYKDEVGYEVESLKAVLYLESIKNPGRIYLGSVNKPFGGELKLRQHIHVVALIPYIDDKGVFIVDVIERQVKTSLDSLNKRYPGEFIHLVNIELN